jgi:Fe2+ transport system protein FeoA
LVDLGLMPNVIVTVVRSAPLNDPIELMLATSNVSLRRTEARTIEVSPLKAQTAERDRA